MNRWVMLSRLEGDQEWRIDRSDNLLRNREYAMLEIPKRQRWPALVGRMFLRSLYRKHRLSARGLAGKKHVYLLMNGEWDSRWTGLDFKTGARTARPKRQMGVRDVARARQSVQQISEGASQK